MKILVLNEQDPDEPRVAATPESVKKLGALVPDVTVESGAGERASIADAQYEAAGATIAPDAADACADADVVLCVRRPPSAVVGAMKRGAILVGMLEPFGDRAGIEAWAAAGVDAFAMELMPRISRAQSMDVLSSQSNLAGYKSVLDAASEFGRAMPMMMTAAGTVAPARVFVLGAGVAGLQAVATARRLGAIVSATDVRPAVKEQVESLGATFVMVESEEAESAETAGGYAKEMSEDYKRRQAALVAETLAKQDIVITTALIPGRKAPVLVTQAMVESMKPGSVIVDLAVEQGGNCPLSKPGEVVTHAGVKIVGHRNVPGRLAVDASALYARNLVNFLTPFADSEQGTVAMDWDDELVQGTGLTRGGELVHASLADEAA